MKTLSELDSLSRRVLGALLEKEQTTPDYYPLTLNALISACNQTTNREPVMSLKQYEVLRGLHSLERHNLVERVTGARVDRWSHLLLDSDLSKPPRKALITVLLLRGSQTVGELKARTDRMYAFSSLEEAEEQLQSLTELDPPVVVELPKRPGQKESRWKLNLSDASDDEDVEFATAPEAGVAGKKEEEPAELVQRVERLEQQVAELQELVNQLKTGQDQPD